MLPEKETVGKCIYAWDKGILLNLVDAEIKDADEEIKRIKEHEEVYRESPAAKAGLFTVEDLIDIQEKHKKTMETLKRRLENTPECEKLSEVV